jgi:phosphomannomutase
MVPAIFDGAADLNITPLNYAIGEGFAHPPNPLIESNLDQLRAAVRDNGADFGACFDGDADRCMFVDESGATVRCDLVTALLGRRFLAKNPGSTVVYDLRSSRVVAEEIRAAGGVPRRERVGHAFMKKAMADTHAVFGGELSGHFYFRDNWNADSGAIVLAVACSAFAAQDKPMSQWIRPLQRYVQTGELNFTVPDKQGKMNELAKLYANGEIDHLDGVTVSYPDWWFNVRPSNTEPLLRLNLEARDQAKLQQELRRIEAVLGKPVAE